MPIIKAHQPLLHRLPIGYLYADPGTGKTSIGNTCENPLLIDFDRAADRSILRKDVLQLDSWGEVRDLEKAGEFANYKTIVIDTAKGALDDYIQPWIISQDAKYGTMKWQLQLYGEMGKEFKRFINSLRRQGCAVFIIAHARKEEERMVPDVTGGSGQFLFRLADIIGYMSIKQGQRVIQFTPSEYQYCKDCANLGIVTVPNATLTQDGKEYVNPEYATFGADLLQKTYNAINSMSIEQQKALETSNAYHERIEECEEPAQLTDILGEVNAHPDHLKLPLRAAIQQKAKGMGWVPNPETKQFERQPEEKKEEGAPAAELFGEEIPRGRKKFDKTYTQEQTIAQVLTSAKTKDEYASLYMANEGAVNASEKLTALFTTKKQELDGVAATA